MKPTSASVSRTPTRTTELCATRSEPPPLILGAVFFAGQFYPGEVDETLARFLADNARALNLDALNVEAAEPEQLRDFTRIVMQELAARGLLRGEERLECWALPRPVGH